MFQLKEYQLRAKEAMERYFQVLTTEQVKMGKIPEELQKEFSYNYPEKVWHSLFPEHDRNHAYTSKTTGHDKPCPNFCLKIPTGGGKTLLATYAIELFQQYCRKSKTGFVLWVVPSDQIYDQTLSALENRAHPYREKLDLISGGRVKIITKNDKITPEDIEGNLVILPMMIQSFARESLKKEMLKFFKDSGKFDEFFPLESNQEKQEKLYNLFPNLDLESEFGSLMGGKIKTSFGNVIKILEPLIILDEGHKAKSELAKSAIAECNPSCVCELTATPIEEANVLFSVSGRELEKEEMIKLDLNLTEKETVEWGLLINYAIDHLDLLQKKADEYKERSGVYIRPINLIQVEATGKDQRGGGKIHAEDVKEYLISTGRVFEDQIAIKTSSQNDIEGIDLLSDQCPVRFIITKQALQEGWDCPFAYSLTVLGGTRSERALTQLVGRVLRQPYAHKTKVKELDESYVFCLQDSSRELIKIIKSGFEYDGMGDLADRVFGSKKAFDPELGERKKQKVRDVYEKSLNSFSLPTFIVKDRTAKNGSRVVDFTLDILPQIPFEKISFDRLKTVSISKERHTTEKTIAIGFARELAADSEEYVEIKEYGWKYQEQAKFKKSFWVQGIMDYVPNPWVADAILESAYGVLLKQFSEGEIIQNQVFLLEEIRKILGGAGEHIGEIYRLAKEVFLDMLKKDEMRFANNFDCQILEADYYFEKEERHKSPTKKSLFEPIIDTKLNVNQFEEDFVWKIDQKDQTYWWYRNKSRKDFYLTGWQKNKFYPDFIFTMCKKDKNSFAEIYLVETKGEHLMGNVDTTYKRELMHTYERDIQVGWSTQTGMGFEEEPKKVTFQFIEQSNVESILNRIFAEST